MEIYSHKIYGSWQDIQEEKHAGMLKIMGKPAFEKIFSSLTLDIGCGNSQFIEFLRGQGIDANIIGLDIISDPNRGFPFVVGDGDEPPFKDETFSAIVCIDTAHLMGTNNFHRTLKKGGFLLFALFFNDENFDHQKDLVRERLDGFEIILEFELQLREKEYVVLARRP